MKMNVRWGRRRCCTWRLHDADRRKKRPSSTATVCSLIHCPGGINVAIRRRRGKVAEQQKPLAVSTAKRGLNVTIRVSYAREGIANEATGECPSWWQRLGMLPPREQTAGGPCLRSPARCCRIAVCLAPRLFTLRPRRKTPVTCAALGIIFIKHLWKTVTLKTNRTKGLNRNGK